MLMYCEGSTTELVEERASMSEQHSYTLCRVSFREGRSPPLIYSGPLD